MERRSLKQQFTFWTVFLVVIPAALIMAIYTASQIQVAKQEKLELIRQRVHSQERLIDYWIAERAATVHELSRTEAFRTLDEQQMKLALNLKQQEDNNFDSLSYIDKYGNFGMTTFNGKIQYPSAIGKPYFESAAAGKDFISDVVIGRNSGAPIINFSSPVYDYAGNFEGLVLGSIKTTTLEILLRENWIGQTGEVFLVNREGTMLTEPRNLDVLVAKGLVESTAKMKFKITNDAFRNIRLGESNTATWIDYRGKKVLGAYLDVTQRGWTLIGKIDEAEVLAPIYKQLAIMAGGILLLILLMILLATLITNRIKRPIEWLIEQADMISAENYTMVGRELCSGEMPYELSNLCDTFIKMNRKIENTVGLLKENEARREKKVVQIQNINTRLEKEIVERQTVQAILEEQIVREKLVAKISTQLANCQMNRLGSYIKIALADIGHFFNVNLSFVYLSCENEKEFRLKYYWYRERTYWQSGTGVSRLEFEKYSWVIQRLKESGQIHIDADTLPDDAIAERQLMNAAQLKSMLLIPMISDSHLIGFLGLASLSENKIIWQEGQAALMKVVIGLVISAVERQRIFQELRKSETDNRALVESIPDIMLRFSSKGRVLSARIDNKNISSIFGGTQLVGRTMENVAPSKIAELFTGAITQAVAKGELQKIEYDIIDNTVTRYREARIVPTRDNTVLAVIRDITEQKKAAETLTNARDVIANAQRMASLGVMAGSIAHEINQPLNSIKVSASGMLYLMQNGVRFRPEDLWRELSRIVDETERINQVISNKCGLVREGLLSRERVLLDDVLPKVLAWITEQDIFKDIKINFRLAPQKTWIVCAKTQIEQILVHLLTNAAQALEDIDQQDKIISISVQVADMVILSVADNGPGVEAASIEKIFEPFFTTGRAVGNMGLGLAIVQSITYACGGEIIAENNLGGGATFRVSFPLIEDLRANGEETV